MRNNHILVFGRGGQLSSELGCFCLPEGWSVECLAPQECDATKQEQVRDAIESRSSSLRAVINAAAYTAVDKAESEAEAAFSLNAEAPRFMAEACAVRNLPFLHVSTDYVFNGTKVVGEGYREDDVVAPLGVYGKTKEAGEQAVRSACPRHIILRTAWVFSPFGGNFVKTMLRLGRERDILSVVSDQHGCPTSAREIARALVAMTFRLSSEPDNSALWGTFHWANQGPTTWFDFAREIFVQAEAHGGRAPHVKPIRTEEYPTPTQRPQNSVLICDKIKQVYGLVPREWREELQDCVAELMKTEAK